jgi:DAPG hydrolase PhiG domain
MNALQAYQLPLQPAPPRILDACRRGVQSGPVPAWQQARQVLGGVHPCPDEVRRNAQGLVLVTCATDLPGVTPDMVDWWFGWHLPESQRYRLWHPTAHVAAKVKEDRSHLSDDRARYIGNESHVDEYIGRSLKKLTIAFRSPTEFGFDVLPGAQATTICATTADRVMGGRGGYLCHHVVRTDKGSQMRSGFWLGEIEHKVPLMQAVLGPVLNSKGLRRLIVPDQMALDLLQHCGEEMNHLARFLPALFADQHGAAQQARMAG